MNISVKDVPSAIYGSISDELRFYLLKSQRNYADYGKEYDHIEQVCSTIVDMGAADADTAIYFASHGAKLVYAYEADKEIYKRAVQNAEKSEFKNRIIIYNEGVYKSDDLDKIIREQHLSASVNNGLKIDIEGCEYPVLLNARRENLRVFKRIALEYHHGYKNLKRKLEGCGFKVYKITAPHYSIKFNFLQGLLHAERID